MVKRRRNRPCHEAFLVSLFRVVDAILELQRQHGEGVSVTLCTRLGPQSQSWGCCVITERVLESRISRRQLFTSSVNWCILFSTFGRVGGAVTREPGPAEPAVLRKAAPVPERRLTVWGFHFPLKSKPRQPARQKNNFPRLREVSASPSRPGGDIMLGKFAPHSFRRPRPVLGILRAHGEDLSSRTACLRSRWSIIGWSTPGSTPWAIRTRRDARGPVREEAGCRRGHPAYRKLKRDSASE